MPLRMRTVPLTVIVMVLLWLPGQSQVMAQRLAPLTPLQQHLAQRHAFTSEAAVFDCIQLTETANTQVEQYYYLYVPEPIDALGLRAVTCLSPQTMPGRGDVVSDDYTENCKSTCTLNVVGLNLASIPDSSGKVQELCWPLDSSAGSTSGMLWKQLQFGSLPAGNYRIAIRLEAGQPAEGAVCIQVGSMLPKRRLKLATSLDLLSKSGE